MMQFTNNFERDCWYNHFENKLFEYERTGREPAATPESAAEYADKILKELQSRAKPS